MKYSRKQIDKAGRIISAEPIDVLEYAEALSVIDDWRKLHLPVLDLLVEQINGLLASNGIVVSFSSKRLKRMISIKEKLRRSPNMGLGGVQDIGGARLVFDDIPTLLRAKECISSAVLHGFTLDHDVYDYVKSPKDSGYRSIHFVFKSHSEDETLDGMRVELQIRTKLQHDWATAVETAELISHSSLKASAGDDNWLEFFKLVSAIFALKESMPVNRNYACYSEEDYCKRYSEINTCYKFVDQLQALVGVVNLTVSKSFNGGYALILIDYNEKKTQLRHFSQEQKDEANDIYSKIESEIKKEEAAVVLVVVSDINELMEAYPSYFLNAKEFISALSDFQKSCIVKGFID
ncbi:MAG: RelA/SpoT domain-containing protein [Bacteroidaceae bacterium]|nr:RelA/SpoT domain-containing protein [Bacteroidaceae bacterium]